MTELQRYLAEEIAEDHADGIITRREALRRLGLMGVTGAAASSLLGAFAAEAAGAGSSSGGGGGGGGRGSSRHGRVSDWAPVPTQEITFPSPRTNPLMGAWAPAAEPRGGVLVIHENRGLTDHIRTVASRLAGSGYSALAVDLLSEEGGTGSFTDPEQIPAALAAVPPERFTADMKAGVSELERRVPGRRLAAIGFCFGGGMVWQLLASGEPRLAAAAPFYGPFPEGGDLSGSRAAVLGVYGGLDARVNATRDAARAALEEARLRHEILTFTEANHAFFNDTGARFNLAAAAEAYHRVLNWYDEFVAKDGPDD